MVVDLLFVNYNIWIPNRFYHREDENILRSPSWPTKNANDRSWLEAFDPYIANLLRFRFALYL